MWPSQDDKRLTLVERVDDRRAGRRGRRAAAATTTWTPPIACAEFVWRDLRDERGRLLRTYRDGEARLAAYLEDYAYLVEALLTLYEATFEVRWFDAARETADLMIELFADPERGGFFTTAHDHERLIARRKDVDDHPIPSGNSSAAYALLRLAALTGEREYERHAVGVFRLLASRRRRRTRRRFAHLLRAIDFHLAQVKEVALVSPASGMPAAGELPRCRNRPLDTSAAPRARGRPRGHQPPRADARALGGRTARAAAYVCEHFACRQPVTEPSELAAALDLSLTRSRPRWGRAGWVSASRPRMRSDASARAGSRRARW